AVATPALMSSLGAGVNEVIWVTSAYLLAYAVPLLITGRLGDRYGPRTIYLVGLVIFTASSLACGLTGSIQGLIVARVVQGLGASLMTPQTMAAITRLFPAHQRGQAMALWGAVAGVATLVGPVLGGILIDSLGWEWIFFVNVPVGIVAFVLAARLVPSFETHPHKFDWLGVVLSGAGLFCLVFGIQEGNTYDWGTIKGPISVWGLIIVGIGLLGVFLWWQRVNRSEPLLPLELLADRNFAVANTAIAVVGFTVTAMPFALMIWAQSARGYSPTQAALISAPTALVTMLLAARVGKLVDKTHPRILATFGFLLWGLSLGLLSRMLDLTTPVWAICIPMALLGVANSFVWGPLSTAATGNLPLLKAGAGAGIYNTTRQIGSVIGSAGVATVMEARIAARLPGAGSYAASQAPGAALPEFVRAGLSQAMSDTMLVPALVIGVASLVTLCFELPRHQARFGRHRAGPQRAAVAASSA
ncbi:MAG: DHA2 family efflux MFS transporter permease subunit, partial [Micrococcales bacterium]|nr:DHA2 family efflux MFS transporter permease subunit [Micrococcales bacterium]